MTITEFLLARIAEREGDVVTAGDVIDCEYATGPSPLAPRGDG